MLQFIVVVHRKRNYSQSLLATVNSMAFLHEANWFVCHNVLAYFLVFWSQEWMHIVYFFP